LVQKEKKSVCPKDKTLNTLVTHHDKSKSLDAGPQQTGGNLGRFVIRYKEAFYRLR